MGATNHVVAKTSSDFVQLWLSASKGLPSWLVHNQGFQVAQGKEAVGLGRASRDKGPGGGRNSIC
jgi:hypothetical protein